MGRAALVLPLDVYGLWLFLVPVFSVSGELPSQAEVTDAFKVLGSFSDNAAVRDVNRDPMFHCLRATRTNFNPEAPSATFDWSLNAGKGKPRRHAMVKYTSGDAPDVIFSSIDSDPSTRKEGRIIYTDYANCGISVMESFGH
ncbi:hypothetical protein MTO96_041807, partial [Rhipicephalus appendiculatus]